MSEVEVECITEFIDTEHDVRRYPHDRNRDADTWKTSKERAFVLDNAGFVRIVDGTVNPNGPNYPWGEAREDRWLETADVPNGQWDRVVACLNIWNDRDALEMSWESWYPYVDHVIAVDGAYSGGTTTTCASTDGTLEFLEKLDKVEIIHAPENGFWKNQVEKRNQYFEAAEDDDLLFIVDADEIVYNGEKLRNLPEFEIGWVPYRKGIYRKSQNFPRLITASVNPRYEGRHYWLTGDRGFITDCQEGGPGYDHAFIPIRIDNEELRDFRPSKRQRAHKLIYAAQYERESKVSDKPVGGRESLRIVQLTSIDAGMVVFRLHSALNSTTPHESAMASSYHDRVYEEPYQWGMKEDRELIRKALKECDVIHTHLNYQHLDRLGVHYTAPVVIHHHGTMYREHVEQCNRRDATKASVRLVSNPELLQYDDNLHYLPNPVPVARYMSMRRRLHKPDPDGYFRIGHSPSKRELKGTEEFLQAIQNLQKKGFKVKAVLIENSSHAESLRRKATECDAFFDSFWLGMQCSGLEAAAMRMPVLAGDQTVREFHGETPYTFVDEGSLEAVIHAMVEGNFPAEAAASRVYEYVVENHDYAAVTKRYLDILDEELDWRNRLTLGGETFLTE